MRINQNIEKKILLYLHNYLTAHKSATIKEILENFSSIPTITEAELRAVINKAVKHGYIKIVTKNNESHDQAEVFLINSIPIIEKNDSVRIVISKPRLRELGLFNIQYRNDQIDTIDCFRTLIDSSRGIIRICSPFMESNVLHHDAFPDLADRISNAFNRDVKIKILSRDFEERGSSGVLWIKNLAEKLDKECNLTIVDYHLLSDSGNVLSSTHAKLIISDDKLAYVGSAELRKNSLIANFEVGCLISGPQVVGLCEIFDTMHSKGTVWK